MRSSLLRNPGMLIPCFFPTVNCWSWFPSGAGFRPSTVGPPFPVTSRGSRLLLQLRDLPEHLRGTEAPLLQQHPLIQKQLPKLQHLLDVWDKVTGCFRMCLDVLPVVRQRVFERNSYRTQGFAKERPAVPRHHTANLAAIPLPGSCAASAAALSAATKAPRRRPCRPCRPWPGAHGVLAALCFIAQTPRPTAQV